jgi:hypothetical protein
VAFLNKSNAVKSPYNFPIITTHIKARERRNEGRKEGRKGRKEEGREGGRGREREKK